MAIQDFDITRLAELEADFGMEDTAEVAAAFMEEAEATIAELADFVSDAADAGRAARLHYLVGAASNLGATGLAALCQHHERANAGFSAADYAEVQAGFAHMRMMVATLLDRAASDAA